MKGPSRTLLLACASGLMLAARPHCGASKCRELAVSLDPLTIDRIEAGWAALESDGSELVVPARCLPPGASEGDVLSKGEVDLELTRSRKEQIRILQQTLLDMR